MKRILITVCSFVAGLVLLGAAKDHLIRFGVERAVGVVTGAPCRIGSLKIGLFSHQITIRRLTLYNPAQFPKGILVDIPTVYVEYDLPSLLVGRVHLPFAVIDLKEVGVVKNKEGKLNVDSLKPVETQKTVQKTKQKGTPQALRIDRLTLSIGRVVLKDYTRGSLPDVKVFEVGIKERHYRTITDASQLVVLILSEALRHTAIKEASIYGIASFAGMGFLPVGAAAMVAGRDSAEAEFNKPFPAVYEAALSVLREKGRVSSEAKERGFIQGNFGRTEVKIKIVSTGQKVKITVSARKLLIPQPTVAGGILYQISERLTGHAR